jgi:hypothetical protein
MSKKSTSLPERVSFHLAGEVLGKNEHKIYSIEVWPPEADPETCKEVLFRIWDGPEGTEHGCRIMSGHPMYVVELLLKQAGYEEVDAMSEDPRRHEGR